MQSKTKLALLIAIGLTLAPVASATWMAYGTHEPDTPYDTPSWMYADPPGTAGAKLYFNAYTMTLAPALLGLATVNPNVGALGTQNEMAHNEWHEALLGVWTDCNGDGYIGMAETAVREYRSELLLDNNVCPPTSGSLNSWDLSKGHNYNGVVSELIPISRFAALTDKRMIADETVKVWGDFGRPDMAPTQRSCTLSPQARGTYQTTGGFINWVDCRVDIIGASNTANGAAGDPLGLSFADSDNAAQDGHPLHMETFGSEDTQNSMAHVWDCGSPSLFRSGDVINSTPIEETTGPLDPSAHDIEIFNVAPSPGQTSDPAHGIPGTYNETNEGLDDCDTSNDRGADFYGAKCAVFCVGEADFNGVDPNNKHEADWNFRFSNSSRGAAPASAINAGTAGMDQNDLGISATGPGGSRWVSDSVWLSKPGFGIVRADLEGSVGLADAYWLTFYAYVGANVTSKGIQLPGGGATLKYGSFHCGGFTSGIHNGWNCDIGTWYANPDGTIISDPNGVLAKVGQPYNMRDVDCADGGNDLGVPIQPAGHGSNPCP